MSEINITHLARLAQLALTPDEQLRTHRDLERIIALIDTMQAADTEGVEPLSHPLEAVQRLRPDAVTEVVDRKKLQQNAPAVEDGLYLVPRVVE